MLQRYGLYFIYPKKNSRDDRARTCGLMLPKHARYQLCYIPIKKSHLYHIVALPDWAIIRAMLINGIWTRDLQSPIDNICWRDFVINNNKTMHTLKDLNSKLWFWRPSCYQLHQRCLKWNSFMLPLTVYRREFHKELLPQSGG